MRDGLPSRPWKNESGIVNLDSTMGKGTHWVAYRKRNNLIEYFDGFGNLKPPRELVNYFGKNAGNMTYNTERYQNYNSYNCGHLCLQFLRR